MARHAPEATTRSAASLTEHPADPACAYDFDRALAACASGSPASFLEAWPLPKAMLANLAMSPAPGQPYGRRVLQSSSRGEVLLVSFADGVFCAPHDHGAAKGFVCLLEGEIEERRFVLQGDALRPTRAQTMRAPALLSVPAQVIHQMKGRDHALALHFYVPAIHHMRIYDQAARRTVTVRDDCGAWLPADRSSVLSETTWR